MPQNRSQKTVVLATILVFLLLQIVSNSQKIHNNILFQQFKNNATAVQNAKELNQKGQKNKLIFSSFLKQPGKNQTESTEILQTISKLVKVLNSKSLKISTSVKRNAQNNTKNEKNKLIFSSFLKQPGKNQTESTEILQTISKLVKVLNSKSLKISTSVKRNAQNNTKKEQNPISQKVLRDTRFEQTNRTVFDCFPYNGQDHLLQLRLLVMSSFVDFFVIVEAQYTYTGLKKQLVFNMDRFKDYAHKIIYFSLPTLPNRERNLSVDEKWENNHFQRNSFIPILKQKAKPQDIVIISDLDEIISKYGFAQYDPQLYPWAVTELRHYYYYFNRASVFDFDGQQQILNYWYNGNKITTFSTIMGMFEGDTVVLRRIKGCQADLSSKIKKNITSQCEGPILRVAGWHFSYVLNDKDLDKKVKGIADGEPGLQIFDYQYQRASSPAPQAYLKDFQLQDANLPMELIADMLKNGQKSIFAPYFVKVIPNQICQEGYIQKGLANEKGQAKIKKTRVVLNLDPLQRNGKELRKIQCIKIQTKSNKNLNSDDGNVETNKEKGLKNNSSPKNQSKIKAVNLIEGSVKYERRQNVVLRGAIALRRNS